MTDQTLDEQVRPIVAAMRAAMRRDEHAYPEAKFLADLSGYIKDLEALLPALPTLSGMPLDEQADCTGMQADLAQGDRVVILDGTPDHDDRVQVLESTFDVFRPLAVDVTPRPDLPRMTWPGDTPDPSPTLPDGWRLADHPAYGRVIVTNPTPDVGGHVYFVARAPSPIGNDWHLCTPDTLTFLDGPGTPPSAEPAPEVHPGVAVGEPVTDPQVMLGISIDAPDGTVVVGRAQDCHPKATVKSGSTWQSTAGMRAHLYHALGEGDYSELESVTVVRWGKETDQ